MHLRDDLHLYIFSQLVWNPWDGYSKTVSQRYQ